MQWNGENIQWADATCPKVLAGKYSTAPNTNIEITFAPDNFAPDAFAGNVSIVGSYSGLHSASMSYNPATYRLTINPSADFSYGENVTVTLLTGIKDLADNALDGDGDGGEGPNHSFSFTIQDEPSAPPTSINVNANVSDRSIEPYDTITISGTATYNNGDPVNGTATINSGSGFYTTPVQNGNIVSRSVVGPVSSRNVSVYVSDGRISDTDYIYVHVSGDSGTASYDLETHVVWKVEDEGGGYCSYWYKEAFRTTDEYAGLLALVDDANLSSDLDFKWRFYYPSGSLYGEYNQPNAFDSSWEWGWAEYHYFIDGASMAQSPGKYKIKFYVDNDRKATENYVVAWDFVNHWTCDTNNDENPIPSGGKTIFMTTDPQVMALHHFEKRSQGMDVKTEFYAPDGHKEVDGEYSFPDDRGPHEWWNDSWHWQIMTIAGTSREYMCGDWTVKLYVKNPVTGSWQLQYTDYFRIQEDVDPSITISASPSKPTETQTVSLNISASDNNHLQKITLHWSGATSGSQTWENINSGNSSPSRSIGSFSGGQSVTYWAETWDESGNRTESEHESFTVGEESVSVPDRPGGPVFLKAGQSATYETGGASSDLGNTVEYQFDWGNSSQSAWGGKSRSKSWGSDGYYFVKAHARSQPNPIRESNWGNSLFVTVDSVAPSVQITTGGGSDFSMNESEVVLEGACADAEPAAGLANVSISSGETNEGTLASWRFVVSLGEGPNQFTITATDNAGNVGRDTITVFYIPPEPDISVDPIGYDFSDVVVGGYSEQDFEVPNDGNETLHVSSSSIEGDDSDQFAILSGGGAFDLEPGNTHSIKARFSPSSTGIKNAILRIISDDPDESQKDVELVGNGVNPGTFIQDTEQNITGATAAVSWGDLENDGYLDFAMIGMRDDRITELYLNDGLRLYYDSTQSFLAVVGNENEGSIVWIDFDNDGDLDLAYSGGSGVSYATKIYENDYGTFVDSQQNIAGLTGNLFWGDYDNDGDLDLFITGYRYGPFSRMYKNQNGILEWDSSQNIDSLKYSSASWGDYDKDGDLDLVHFGDNGSEHVANIYNNDSGVLITNFHHSITGLDHSTAVWVDYDGDGDLDIVVTGCVDSKFNVGFYIFENIEGQFVEDLSNRIEGFGEMTTFTYGDYDNDGDYDFLIRGMFYKNQNGIISHDTEKSHLEFNYGPWSIDFGDYDNDGDLDILGSGFRDIRIYKNTVELIQPNSLPVPPMSDSLISQVDDSARKVELSWDDGSDYETNRNLLTYNLRVGTNPGSNDIISGIIPPGPGNVGNTLSHVVKNIDSGTYYWSVQTVDTGFAKSEWSGEKTFVVRKIHHVDLEAIGIKDGSSWEDAYTDLQEALTAANEGDEIWVAGGKYLISNVINLIEPIAIYGGFAGWETQRNERNWVLNKTIVDAQGSGTNFHVTTKAVVDGVTITGAGSGVYDAGIRAEINSDLHIVKCRIENNGHNGIVTFGKFKIENTVIAGNGNRGLSLSTGSDSIIVNNTLVDNAASGIHVVGTGPRAVIKNNIVAFNPGKGIHNASGTSIVELGFNNVYNNGVNYQGPGLLRDSDISADPLFIDSLNGDYHLFPQSPCIDSGDPNSDAIDDFDGELRPQGSRFDIGADEFKDSDSDSIPDYWEYKWFGDLSRGADTHSDNDTLTDLEEFQYGTDPENPDSDGDGFNDDVEVSGNTDPNDPDDFPAIVTFPDINLEFKIRETIGKPIDLIYESDLLTLITLNAGGSDIVDITGLDKCTNLANLTLDNNSITSISPLSKLINLTSLNISRNQVGDINALSGLTNLTTLKLYLNQITDISPLSGFTAVRLTIE